MFMAEGGSALERRGLNARIVATDGAARRRRPNMDKKTIRTMRDAAINAWIDRMDDGAWLAATLRRLRHTGHLAQGGGGRAL